MPYEALKIIRPFVKASSFIAPRLTGNLAFRLFCTPPRVKNLDPSQAKMIKSAQDRLSQALTEKVSFEDGFVQTYRFRTDLAPTRGTILLLHGWTGRAAFMTAFVAPLLAAGFDVLCVDLPAHGESSGRRLNIPLGIKALHAVHKRFGAWFGIVAHSFGGAVATSVVAGAMDGFAAIPVNCMVLIATPHSMPELFSWFGKTLGLTAKGQYWLNDNVRRLTGHELARFEGKDMLQRAGTRTLLLHAPDDKEVPFSGAEIMAGAGVQVTLKPMTGLGHRRILYARPTVDCALAFMAGPESPALKSSETNR
jgi:pimeloyl-ACP methyl ester carboxylesterase